jgi:hypothetical protein
MKKLPLLAALTLSSFSTFAQGTAFTYQGRLNDGANPASGIYDLRFAIYDLLSAGIQQGSLLTNSATAVSNGLFTVALDFGNQFPGADRWLEIAARTNGGGAFTTLAPRQKLTATPYAITAENLNGTVSGSGLSGTYGSAVTLNNANNSFSGAFTGNGASVSNVNAASLNGLNASNFWLTGGNNVAAGQFLGSTNNQPVEIKVNGQRALRLEPDAFGFGAPNVIGGSSLNYIAPGTVGAVIAGGGAISYAFFVESNSVAADFGAIGGGFLNKIQGGAVNSVIGGGTANEIQTNSREAIISGGYNNQIQANSFRATIAGGFLNVIGQNATNSFIGGGDHNAISDYAFDAAVGGGSQNSVAADFGTIGGGSNNMVNSMFGFIGGGQSNTSPYPYTHTAIGGGQNNTASGFFSVIGGGSANQTAEQGAFIGGGDHNLAAGFDSVIGGGSANHAAANSSVIGGGAVNSAGGAYSTVPGGNLNIAGGNYSFAAGQQARALHDGTFVWSDSQNSAFASTANNQFLIRAAGGVGINISDPAGAALAVNGGIKLLSGNTLEFGAGVAGKEPNAGKIGYQSFTPGSLDIVGAGTSSTNRKIQFYCEGGANFTGPVNPPSDRNLKQDFQAVNALDVLNRVVSLPIQAWVYKFDESKRHIGPVAQDFHAAFGLNGADDKHIATVDADGVALAAIQGLNEKVESGKQKAETRIERLEVENAELKQRLEALEKIIRNQQSN